MKLLTLVRHAKSSWGGNIASDFDRPLNQRGTRDAPRMGRALAEAGIVPDQIISSPAKRAITTARMLAGELSLPDTALIENDALYGADLQSLYYILHCIADQHKHVFLVGHNPGMHWLTTNLTGSPVEKFMTCGVARLQLEVAGWENITPGCASLIQFYGPKEL